MKNIVQSLRSLTTGIITLPVSLLLRLLMKFTGGPVAAMAVMFLFVLFSNFASVIPMLFFHKNLELLTIWGEVTAYLNIITLQYILIIPMGALLFQFWSWTKHGLHIDSRVLLFLLAVYPAVGGAGAALAMSVIGGLRYTIMPENHIVIPVLSSMSDIHSAPWFSTGYINDILRIVFPFHSVSGWKGIAIMLYASLCTLWFAFSIWREYYAENETGWRNSRITAGRLNYDWRSLSAGRKFCSAALAVFLFTVSGLIMARSGYSLYTDHIISSEGVDTVAFLDKSHHAERGTGAYEVKYYFYAGDLLSGGAAMVEYPFEQYAKQKLSTIPVRYYSRNPAISRIRYSAIFNIDVSFDNSSGSNLIAFIAGVGLFFGGLFAFPGMALASREKESLH